MDVREILARKMIQHAEERFGSQRGRELLGFDTLESFVDDGWRNYLPYVDIVLSHQSKSPVNLEAVNRTLSATVQKQEREIAVMRKALLEAAEKLERFGLRGAANAARDAAT